MACGVRGSAAGIANAWACFVLLTNTEATALRSRARGPERRRGRRERHQTRRHGNGVTSRSRLNRERSSTLPELVTPAASSLSATHGVVDEAQGVNPQPLVGFSVMVGGRSGGGGSPE